VEARMKRHTDRPMGAALIYTAPEVVCAACGNPLPICQVISRVVQGLDEPFALVRKDRQCRRRDCPAERPRPFFYAPRDLRVVLSNRIYGLDVTLCVGERHLREGVALAQITRDLTAQGVPLDQRHTGRIFRDFLTLASLERGDDAALQARLRAEGGIVLMCDGVQFDDRSPVLYVVWDARTGTPLFGERKPFRGENDLVPLLERVRRMDVPVIGVVTDKETGLVPAVERVFPGVPTSSATSTSSGTASSPCSPISPLCRRVFVAEPRPCARSPRVWSRRRPTPRPPHRRSRRPFRGPRGCTSPAPSRSPRKRSSARSATSFA
jgi:hypothetical protein